MRTDTNNAASKGLDSKFCGKTFKDSHRVQEVQVNSCSNIDLQIEFKLGIKLTANESKTWGNKLNKLTSTRHKNSLLKSLHGEVYTKEKLHRFGLSADNKCPRCNEVENLSHKLFECCYTKKIWDTAIPILKKLNILNTPNEERIKLITATTIGTSLDAMTLTAEIHQTILQLRHDQNYLLHPKYLVKRAIKNLSVKEKNKDLRKIFIELVNDVNGE